MKTNIAGNQEPMEPYEELIEDYEEDRIAHRCTNCWMRLLGQENTCPHCGWPIKWGENK